MEPEPPLDLMGGQTVTGIHMIERQISTNTVAAGAAWTLTALLYVAAGALMLSGRWKWALLVAELACGASAAAAVRHIRCYAANICRRIDDVSLNRDIATISGVPRQAERPRR